MAFSTSAFNARAEGVEKAGMWKQAFAVHRCLVSADSFYEWQKIRPKNHPKYEIAMKNGGLFAFAGLWGTWKNPATGDWLQSYTINRMPVILHPKDYARWLSLEDTNRPPFDLLWPFEPEKMTASLTGNKQDEIFGS